MNYKNDLYCPDAVVDVIVPDGPDVERTLAGLARVRTRTPWRHRVVARASWPVVGAMGGDVVLLRAGVQVFDGWLDRLRAAVYAAPSHATATPFGGGRFASYPGPGAVGVAPADAAALDAVAANVNRGLHVRLPLPGGDCVYVRGAYLDARLGRTASLSGWRHVLAADVLVYSDAPAADDFGNDADAAAVACHVRLDPARPLRRRLDLARLNAPGPTLLMVTHYGGGGTGRHVRDMAGGLTQEGARVLLLSPTADGRLRLERFDGAALPNLIFEMEEEYYTLLTALQCLGCRHVHVQHLLGHPPQTMRLVADLGLPYDLTLHDYHYACPRIHLHDHAGRYCGEPSPPGCNACLARNGDFLGVRGPATIDAWRGRHAAWLAGARRVFVPHAEVGRRMSRYFPHVHFHERPHPEIAAPVCPPPPAPAAGETLRVALLGLISVHKGLDVLTECARDAAARRLPLFFQVIGATHPEQTPPANMAVSGEYREEEVFDRIRALRVHCALFLSIIPETYSYTLSIAKEAGLYPLAFDLGAVGARIRESGWGEVFPLTTAAAAINDRLLAAVGRLRAGVGSPPPRRHYESLLRDYYGLDLAGPAVVEPARRLAA